MYIGQAELPVERDAVQCRDGTWVFIRYRMSPSKVLLEAKDRETVWKAARVLSQGPIWEERYVGMQLVDCMPPPNVWRRKDTRFLVTDGTPQPTPAPVESGVFLSGKKYEETEDAPKTPLSAGVDVKGWALVKKALAKTVGRK